MHEKFVYQLWEFENDDIIDFEGYGYMEDKDDEYDEWQRYKNIPKKGPIPKKKKKNKKKKSSS